MNREVLTEILLLSLEHTQLLRHAKNLNISFRGVRIDSVPSEVLAKAISDMFFSNKDKSKNIIELLNETHDESLRELKTKDFSFFSNMNFRMIPDRKKLGAIFWFLFTATSENFKELAENFMRQYMGDKGGNVVYQYREQARPVDTKYQNLEDEYEKIKTGYLQNELKVKELQARILELNRTVSELNEEKSNYKKKSDSLLLELDKSRKEKSDLEARKDEYKTKDIDVLEKELNNLNHKLEKKDAQLLQNEQSEIELINKIRVLEFKLDNLKKQFEKIEAKKPEIKEISLSGRTIGMIGGRENLEAAYKKMAEELDGNLIRNSGFEGLTSKQIEAIVSKADIIILVSDSVSHSAYDQLDTACKKLGKNFFYHNSSGVSSLKKFISSLVAGD